VSAISQPPRLRRLTSLRLPAAVTLAAFCIASSGCLSHEYRVSRSELQRLAEMPPEARGAHVRVVQKLGARRAAAVDPSAPPAWSSPSPEALPPPDQVVIVDDGYDDGHGHGHVYVSGGWGSGGGGGGGGGGGRPWRGPAAAPPVGPRAPLPQASAGGAVPARPAMAAGGRAPGSGAAVARPASAGVPKPAPASGGGGGGLRLGGGGGGGSDELVVLAVIAIAVASLAAVGLAATEGVRYDGQAAVAPGQLVYLQTGSGERPVPLASLTTADLAGVDEGLIRDDEGYGLARLGRAPLDRQGFAFKVDFGGIATELDHDLVSGFASHIQVGYFPHHRFGLLAGAALAGVNDAAGNVVARHALTAEAQLFPLSWRRLHLGAAGHVGTTLVSGAADGSPWGGPTVGGAALLEVALTTRLSLTARWDWNTRRSPTGQWSPASSLAAGIAIY
jgi:hypothetical protein